MNDPISQNVLGVQSLVGSKLNKINTSASTQEEGPEGEFVDALTLKLDDEELLALSHKWETDYMGYEAAIKIRQQANKTYYLGRQKQGFSNVALDGTPISANLLFEAEETFLPAALSKNPEPVVWADNTTEGSEISNIVKTMLQYHADTLVLRRKLMLVTRHWSIYFLGIMKHGWNPNLGSGGDITSEVRDPQNFIFDPDGFIDSYGDYEGYLGERITVTADKLVKLFPKHAEYIILTVKGKMGTSVTYTEWWNDDYCFTTYKAKILDKSKNPHFKYDKVEKETDQFGNEENVDVKGSNHFSKPKKPYTFLSVFSLGDHPHDDTGLIEQNIPNQNRITRRTEQIDLNLSKANNSDVFSQNNFNQQTAKQAARAMANGNPVLAPSGGPIKDAIVRLQAPSIGSEFFQELEVSKQDLRSIFGTEGISSQQPNENSTARGMILNQQFDNSRIGGGIGDALEQFADNVFNWWTQLYYVYYDEKHYGVIMGNMKATEYVELSSQDLDRRLVISVSPDSMKPKDEITQMNQAMSLYEAGVLDPKTLLTMLNIPDPQKTAEATVLWLLDKNAYLQMNFPELAQQMAQMQQAQAPGAPPGPGGQPVPNSPPSSISAPPANSSLSQVPINSQSLPK